MGFWGLGVSGFRGFGKFQLPAVQPGSTLDETCRSQFLSDLQTTRRAMLAAFGSILDVAQDLDRIQPTSAETITLPVKLLNRSHLYSQVTGHRTWEESFGSGQTPDGRPLTPKAKAQMLQAALLLRHLLFPGYGIIPPGAPSKPSTVRSKDALLPAPWLAFLLNELLALGKHSLPYIRLRSSTTSCGTFGARSKLCRLLNILPTISLGTEVKSLVQEVTVSFITRLASSSAAMVSAIGDLSSLARTSSVIAAFAATRSEGFVKAFWHESLSSPAFSAFRHVNWALRRPY